MLNLSAPVIIDLTVRCSICGSFETRINTFGRPVWRYTKEENKAYCYKCGLQMMKNERETNSIISRCQSDVCRKARGERGAMPNYERYSYCKKCRANYSKSLKRCPCPECHQRLRTKARYNKEKKKSYH